MTQDDMRRPEPSSDRELLKGHDIGLPFEAMGLSDCGMATAPASSVPDNSKSQRYMTVILPPPTQTSASDASHSRPSLAEVMRSEAIATSFTSTSPPVFPTKTAKKSLLAPPSRSSTGSTSSVCIFMSRIERGDDLFLFHSQMHLYAISVWRPDLLRA